MSREPLTRRAYGGLNGRFVAALTDGAIPHDAHRIDTQLGAIRIDADGAHLDAVEHKRQDRLKRWQKLPVPTRKA